MEDLAHEDNVTTNQSQHQIILKETSLLHVDKFVYLGSEMSIQRGRDGYQQELHLTRGAFVKL